MNTAAQPKQLIRKHIAAKTLCVTPNGLDSLMARDDSFPRPVKLGASRQAAVFFVLEELNRWIEEKQGGEKA